MNPKICIVGSANIDQISYVDTIPSDGETVFGDSYQMGFGGKGANQAVMAGLLGADVYMIACLGTDVYNKMTVDNLNNNNVNTDYIQTVDGSSGVAPIWVDKTGQNRIIVIPGANNLIDGDVAINSLDKIGSLDVLVGQFEIPLEVNEKVFEYANNNGVQTVLNPAPAGTISEKLLNNTSWFIPNEVEFEEMLGEPFNEKALLQHSKEVKPEIIVTLGEKGCAEVSDGKVYIHQAKKVTAVDTTGAGDAFVGTFSYGLASKMTKQDSILLALEKATNSVTKKGTQSSYKD
jgi:ribokinase|tara:strand:+ start:1685 stop:2554 length:870 start_codon:yes stop_codon:yes gene_type:complete